MLINLLSLKVVIISDLHISIDYLLIKVNIFKVNTDQEPEVSGAFGIQSVPSLLFIPMDDKPQMTTGALPKKVFEEIIRDVLKVN